jgi:hypothetical protein
MEGTGSPRRLRKPLGGILFWNMDAARNRTVLVEMTWDMNSRSWPKKGPGCGTE